MSGRGSQGVRLLSRPKVDSVPPTTKHSQNVPPIKQTVPLQPVKGPLRNGITSTPMIPLSSPEIHHPTSKNTHSSPYPNGLSSSSAKSHESISQPSPIDFPPLPLRPSLSSNNNQNTAQPSRPPPTPLGPPSYPQTSTSSSFPPHHHPTHSVSRQLPQPSPSVDKLSSNILSPTIGGPSSSIVGPHPPPPTLNPPPNSTPFLSSTSLPLSSPPLQTPTPAPPAPPAPVEKVHPLLFEALEDERSRKFLLKLERQCQELIQDTQRYQVDVSTSSAYERVILHRLAEFFHLGTTNKPLPDKQKHSNGAKVVVLYKIESTRMPSSQLVDLHLKKLSQPEPKRVIIQQRAVRPQPSSAVPTVSNPSTSPKSLPPSTSTVPQPAPVVVPPPDAEVNKEIAGRAYEERVEAYKKLRSQIFSPELDVSSTSSKPAEEQPSLTRNLSPELATPTSLGGLRPEDARKTQVLLAAMVPNADDLQASDPPVKSSQRIDDSETHLYDRRNFYAPKPPLTSSGTLLRGPSGFPVPYPYAPVPPGTSMPYPPDPRSGLGYRPPVIGNDPRFPVNNFQTSLYPFASTNGLPQSQPASFNPSPSRAIGTPSQHSYSMLPPPPSQTSPTHPSASLPSRPVLNSSGLTSSLPEIAPKSAYDGEAKRLPTDPTIRPPLQITSDKTLSLSPTRSSFSSSGLLLQSSHPTGIDPFKPSQTPAGPDSLRIGSSIPLSYSTPVNFQSLSRDFSPLPRDSLSLSSSSASLSSSSSPSGSAPSAKPATKAIGDTTQNQKPPLSAPTTITPQAKKERLLRSELNANAKSFQPSGVIRTISRDPADESPVSPPMSDPTAHLSRDFQSSLHFRSSGPPVPQDTRPSSSSGMQAYPSRNSYPPPGPPGAPRFPLSDYRGPDPSLSSTKTPSDYRVSSSDYSRHEDSFRAIPPVVTQSEYPFPHSSPEDPYRGQLPSRHNGVSVPSGMYRSDMRLSQPTQPPPPHPQSHQQILQPPMQPHHHPQQSVPYYSRSPPSHLGLPDSSLIQARLRRGTDDSPHHSGEEEDREDLGQPDYDEVYQQDPPPIPWLNSTPPPLSTGLAPELRSSWPEEQPRETMKMYYPTPYSPVPELRSHIG